MKFHAICMQFYANLHKSYSFKIQIKSPEKNTLHKIIEQMKEVGIKNKKIVIPVVMQKDQQLQQQTVELAW